MYAKRFQKYTYVWHQSSCKTWNTHDPLPQNYMQWHTVFPSSPTLFTLCTQHSIFTAFSCLPLPIFVILRPIKALLAYITISLPRVPSNSPSLVRTRSRLHAHTQTVARLCPVTQEVVISLGAQFTLTVPNERFPTLPFPDTPHPPFGAFSITILSESFIYPLSSFIPVPIILASLPSMTHSSVRPIYLPALFFHHRCHFCQPISPSSVLLPPFSFLISSCHH